jgi:hypothetical protein
MKEEIESFQWRNANLTDFDPRGVARKVGGSLPDYESVKRHTSIRAEMSSIPPRSFPDFISDVGIHVNRREAACAE